MRKIIFQIFHDVVFRTSNVYSRHVLHVFYLQTLILLLSYLPADFGELKS